MSDEDLKILDAFRKGAAHLSVFLVIPFGFGWATPLKEA